MRRLTVPTGAACAALLVAACGGSARHVAVTRPTPAATVTVTVRTRTATTPPPTAAEIERAATLTAAEPGFRARLSASIKLPQFNGNPLTAAGSGYFDPATSSGTLGVAVGLPGLLGLGGPLPTQLRLVGSEAYARVPSELAGQVPRADAWLASSISALDLGDSLNPADILREIARDATRHVPGQRARVTIDPATGLVRTIVLNYAVPGGYHVHVRLTLTGFKPQAATDAPPSSQTGNLQSALRALGF
ncbi:MAG TPA: hypothetical protein VHU61_07310 [Solirubrobacteraceae bacterium]|nr:hypothetical protein [Solirubrobacteraceae bacterium]